MVVFFSKKRVSKKYKTYILIKVVISTENTKKLPQDSSLEAVFFL
jgi:hypothetical protein